jgi:hypothetical protein
MTQRRTICFAASISALATVIVCMTFTSLTRAQEQGKYGTKVGPPPNVAGNWTGDWGMYSPPPKSGEVPAAVKKMMYPDACKVMDCSVEKVEDGKYQATFQGECGRPYKYKITMMGRGVGGTVMFQGSADLGEKDGGVFDWIGRATDKEFVGFFTSQAYTGTFRLARGPKAASATN